MSETEPKGVWSRLIVALTLSTIGGSGFWSVIVALPAIATAFAANRADASLAYIATMVGYAGGTLVMARLADRRGITLPLAAGTAMLGLGYAGAAAHRIFHPSCWCKASWSALAAPRFMRR